MTEKEAFGHGYGGITFLALVQIKSTYSHERYRLRWYTIGKNGSCVPGDVTDLDDPRLQVIQNRITRVALWDHTYGCYTVGRPSWRTVDRDLLAVVRNVEHLVHKYGDDAVPLAVHYMRLYGIAHNRRNDPFRKIWPTH